MEATAALGSKRFKVERPHPSVVRISMDGIQAGWEQFFLLQSDVHHDNLYCNQELERLHLEQAKERGAGILDFGDRFDAMQGKFDKRQDKDQMRPELRAAGKSHYGDALVKYLADFCKPYAENFVLLATGNHEDSYAQRHETNLTERLAERLKMAGSPVQVGGVQGWVHFKFTARSSFRQSIHLRYTHGYGGGGPVTRDVIQAQRQLAYIGNADILVSGHTHDAWYLTARCERLDHNGMPILYDVDCIKCPGYKDEYSPGVGWAALKGLQPKPLGAWWLHMWYDKHGIHKEFVRAGDK